MRHMTHLLDGMSRRDMPQQHAATLTCRNINMPHLVRHAAFVTHLCRTRLECCCGVYRGDSAHLPQPERPSSCSSGHQDMHTRKTRGCQGIEGVGGRRGWRRQLPQAMPTSKRFRLLPWRLTRHSAEALDWCVRRSGRIPLQGCLPKPFPTLGVLVQVGPKARHVAVSTHLPVLVHR